MGFDWNHNYSRIARESGFKLRNVQEGTLDWRFISSFEIEKIVKEQNFERIDEASLHISEVPLGNILNTQVLEASISKYFILAQLSVQYLLFCKKFLDETLTSLRISLKEVQIENMQLKENETEKNAEMLQLHKKLQRMDAINKVVYPCTMCTKNFISNEMLNTHIQRKHPNGQNDKKSAGEIDRNLIDTIKLELEIKQLKERLNVAEKEIKDRHFNIPDNKPCTKCNNQATTSYTNVAVQSNIRMQSIGIQSNLEESKETDDNDIKEDIQEAILTELREKIALFETWRFKEQKENEQSVAEIKEKLHEIVSNLDKQSQLSADQVTNDPDNEINVKQLTEDMLQACNKNIISLFKKSEERLNETLDKVERNYEGKLESLDALLQKYRKEIQTNSTNFEKGIEKTLTIPQKTIASNSIQIDKFPNHKLEQILEDSTENEESSESDTEDTQSSEEFVQSKPHTFPRVFEVSSTPKKPNSLASSEVSTEEPRQRRPPVVIDARKYMKSRLTSLGINTKQTSVPNKDMHEISSILAESRNSNKKRFKDFFITRNKLKTLVGALSKERQNAKNPTPKLMKGNTSSFESVIENEEMISTTESQKQTFSNQQKNKELPFKEVLPVKPLKEVLPVNSTPKYEADFNSRLERILGSPVRKPGTAITHNFVTENEIKPVPAPRKKVMFDFHPENSYDPDKKQNAPEDSDLSTISSIQG